MRELQQLREENAKKKKLVADLSLDKILLQDINQKKLVKPAQRKREVRYLKTHDPVRVRRACQLAGLSETSYYYRPRSEPQNGLRQRVRDL